MLHISKGVRWQGNVSRTEIIRGGNALKIGVVGRWERTLQRDVCLVILWHFIVFKLGRTSEAWRSIRKILHLYDLTLSGGGRGCWSQWPQFKTVLQHLQMRKQWMFLTTDRSVLTFISTTSLESFNETSRRFASVFVAMSPGVFNEILVHLSLCFRQTKQWF